MATKKKTPAKEHLDEMERRYNVIDQKLDAIAHVRINGSVGLEPALTTLYEYAKSNKANIEQIKEETQLMRDLHKVYLLYLKYGAIRLVVKSLVVLGIGQLVGFSIKEVIGLIK